MDPAPGETGISTARSGMASHEPRRGVADVAGVEAGRGARTRPIRRQAVQRTVS